jgi:D-aminoacyl-tRNA deacylase
MRTVLQRVSKSELYIDNKLKCKINKGINALVCFKETDTIKTLEYYYNKIINLRIFEDENKKMNKSLLDINGEILIVPQFTLYADCKKGRRPFFKNAASPVTAEKLFNLFIDFFYKNNIKCQCGIFAEKMVVNIFNDGPVTIILDDEL